MKNHTTMALVLSWLAASAAACSYSGEQVYVESPSVMSDRASQDGIAVGAKVYVDPAEAEKVFGLPIVFESRTATGTTRGYLPVLVSFANSTDDGLLVDKERTRLISSDGQRAKPRSWDRMYQTFEPSMAGAYVAAGVVGVVAQNEANKDMAADWKKKELPDRATIHPNSEGIGGFLYFKDKGGLAPYLLQVVLERRSDGERVVVSVPVDPERS